MGRTPKNRAGKGLRPRRLEGDAVSITAALSMRRADESFLGGDRIGLLEAIDRFGSISRAAREVGISYKTAWDAVDAVNNAADKPLVRRTSGGTGGGGTVLTDEGKETVRLYRVLHKEHETFLRRLEGRIGDLAGFYSLMRRVAMRVSARNVLTGTVAALRKGAVNTEVTLALKGGESICSVITNESAEALGLAKGKEAYALFKASVVILGRDLHNARVSARNILCGTVARIEPGAVNSEVRVALPGGAS